LTKLGTLGGPDRNAWRAGLWPAGRVLDTPGLVSCFSTPKCIFLQDWITTLYCVILVWMLYLQVPMGQHMLMLARFANFLDY